LILIRIRHTQDFTALARRLQGASRDLRSELYRAINRATLPAKEDVRGSAYWRLPKSGGLNRRVAESKIVTKRRMSGKNAGVRIVGTSGYDIGSINRGRVRHLTFGHLPWRDQAVTPGFWTDPLKAIAPQVRREIDEAVKRIANQIEKG
jgi:hypothetical protein